MKNNTGRTLVIGDIHGGHRALLQVLERCNFKEDDTLISLGDIADGWSESPECVDELLKIKNLIPIRGNHDIWLKDWLNKGHRPIIWTYNGGFSTIEAYLRTGDVMNEAHKDFFNNQLNWYIDDENRLFIHGGWDYRTGMFEIGATQPNTAGIGAMECHWNRSLFESTLAVTKAGRLGRENGVRFKALEQFKEVYIGHTALKDGKPFNGLNLWNLDTGAGWHGKLTIMDVDTKEYWQSDIVSELYPEEKGR